MRTKRNKFIILIMLIIVIILSACSQKNILNEEDDKIASFSVDCMYEAFNISTVNDTDIYVCDKDKIYLYNSNGKKVDTIDGEFEFCSCLALDKDIIYAFDNTSNSITMMDRSGKTIHNYHIDKEGFALKMELDKDNIYILQQDYKSNYYKKFISIFNRKNNKNELLEIDGLVSFTTVEDGTILLALQEDRGTKLSLYDIKSKEEIKSYTISSFLDDLVYGYDNCLYFTSGKSARKLYMDDMKEESVFSNDKSSFGSIVINGNYCYLLDNANKLVYRVYKSSLSDMNAALTVLTHISGFESEVRMNDTIIKLKEKYPNINLKFISFENMQYYSKLKKKVMAGDTDFDIFYLHDDEQYDFIRNEAMVNLNNYSSIIESFNGMFEGILNCCNYNNYLIGVPTHVNVKAWKVNQSLLEDINMELPDGFWDWNDFYNFAHKMPKDLNGDGVNDIYVIANNKRFPPFYDQYNCINTDLVNGKVSYADNTLLELLKLWKKIWDENLIVESRNMKESKENILFTDETVALNEGESHLVYVPYIPGKPVFPAQFNLFCINKYSKNKDIAAEFLSFFISKEVQTAHPETGAALYEDMSSYNKTDQRFSLPLSNDKNYSIYKNILENCAPRKYKSEINLYAGDLMEKCFNGEIEPEEVLELLDKKAQMVIGE